MIATPGELSAVMLSMVCFVYLCLAGNGTLISTNDVIEHANQAKYAIDGTYNLQVIDLEWTDGGLYECVEGTQSYKADLVVFIGMSMVLLV